MYTFSGFNRDYPLVIYHRFHSTSWLIALFFMIPNDPGSRTPSDNQTRSVFWMAHLRATYCDLKRMNTLDTIRL